MCCVAKSLLGMRLPLCTGAKLRVHSPQPSRQRVLCCHGTQYSTPNLMPMQKEEGGGGWIAAKHQGRTVQVCAS